MGLAPQSTVPKCELLLLGSATAVTRLARHLQPARHIMMSQSHTVLSRHTTVTSMHDPQLTLHEF